MRVTYEAVRGDGKRLHGTIAARSLADARRILEDRGLEQIRFPIGPVPIPEELASAEQFGPTGWSLWRSVGLVAALCVAVIAWGIYGLATGDSAAWSVAEIVVVTLLVPLGMLPPSVFRSLREDRQWSRWRPMLRKARYLQLWSRLVPLRIVRLGMDFEVARALAGLGRLPEALAVVARHREGTPEQRQLYQGLLVTVYDCALDFDAALRTAREYVELAPDDANARLDLAMRYAVQSHDAARARAELAQVESGKLSGLTAAFRHLVLGIVLAEEGSWSESRASLDAAHAAFAKVTLTSGVLAVVSAYRAWANAGLGRGVDAARELDSARSMLDAGDGGLTTRHIDAGIAALSRGGA